MLAIQTHGSERGDCLESSKSVRGFEWERAHGVWNRDEYYSFSSNFFVLFSLTLD